MNITPVDDRNFGAKFSAYPKTITNLKVNEMFEAKTQKFPNLKLLQDDISYIREDSFFLLNEKGQVLGFSTQSFTSDYPRTLDGIVNRLVGIFNEMVKNAKL